MNYLYTHSISYYVGNNRIDNIFYAIKQLNSYRLSQTQSINDKILIIICCIYDDLTDNIKREFENFKNLNTDRVDIAVIYRWNTGGTTQTISYSLDYIIDNNINTLYIGIWEDDSIFKNIYILDIVKEYLDKGNIIVGCHVTEYERPEFLHINGTKEISKRFYRSKHQPPWCRRKHIYFNDLSDELIDDSLIKWIDGALYISTIENLIIIKKKLIKFTLAPENIRYTHIEQGINYGEVGFPTRLHINEFKFYGLLYDSAFKHLNINSIGNKTI